MPGVVIRRAMEDLGEKPIAVLLNLTMLGWLYFVSATRPAETTLWTYGAAQVVLYASHLLYLRLTGQEDIFDALNILNVGLFLHFTLAPFFIHYEVMPTFYGQFSDVADFPRALVLTHALCVMVQVGYYLDLFKAQRRPAFSWDVSAAKLLLLALFIFGVRFLMPYVSESIQHSGVFVTLISLVFYLPYFLLIMKPPGAPPAVSLIVYSALFLSVATSVYAGIGSKAGVANLVLAFVFYWHYFVCRVSLCRAAIGAIACLMAVTYMGYLRTAGGADLIEMGLEGSTHYAANISPERLNPFSPENTEFFLSGGVSAVLTPFEAFMVVLHTFPELLPFQNGWRLMEDMIYPLAPRILFPSKPEIYGAQFFWDDLLGQLSHITESGAISKSFEAISLPGHYYLDFGLPGLLASGLLLGVIHRYIYRRLVLNGVTRGSICLYGIISAYALIASRAFMWDGYFIIVAVVFPAILIRVLRRATDLPLVKACRP